MAHVSGPTSSLPYSRHIVPTGTMCDEHPDRPAVARVQGETDSFGAEYIDCCQECADELAASREVEREKGGVCDWCHTHQPRLSNRRDIDEGSSGPVYRVCDPCIRKDNDRIDEELEWLNQQPRRNYMARI